MRTKTRKTINFEMVYDMYRIDAFKIGFYYTKDEALAEEMAQAAFVKLFLHFDDVNSESVRSYLFLTVRNLSYNWMRDHKRLTYTDSFEVFEDDPFLKYQVEDIYLRKEQKKAAKELSDRILSRLREINPSWYEAVTMVYCLEIPHEVVALQLGVHVDVIHSRLYRAKQWIRRTYKDKYEEVRWWC